MLAQHIQIQYFLTPPRRLTPGEEMFIVVYLTCTIFFDVTHANLPLQLARNEGKIDCILRFMYLAFVFFVSFNFYFDKIARFCDHINVECCFAGSQPLCVESGSGGGIVPFIFPRQSSGLRYRSPLADINGCMYELSDWRAQSNNSLLIFIKHAMLLKFLDINCHKRGFDGSLSARAYTVICLYE